MQGYATILLVDSDPSFRADLEGWLIPRGFKLESAITAHEALERYNHQQHDLVILSMLLCDRDGLSVCREICQKGSAPVLMISETATTFDEVAGLEAGADDFLAKPLLPEVTLARIRALLRRTKRMDDHETLAVGDLKIDRPRFQVSCGNINLSLTPIEFKLLSQLALAQGAPRTRDALIQDIWSSDYCGDRRLVDTHVRNLRRKLREAGSIVSVYGVRGVGYRLASDYEAPSSVVVERKALEIGPKGPSEATCRSQSKDLLSTTPFWSGLQPRSA